MREKHYTERQGIDRPGGRDTDALLQLLKSAPISRTSFLGVLFFLALGAGSVLALGLGMRLMIDKGLFLQDSQALKSALLFLGGVIAVMAVASYGRLYMVTRLTEDIIQTIKEKVFRSILEAPIAFFELTKTGELLSRLNTDTMLLQILLGTSLPILVRNMIIFLGGAAMMVWLSPLLSLTTFLVVPLISVPLIILGRRVKGLSRATQDEMSQTNAFAEENLYAIKTVKSFAREPWAEERFHHFLQLSRQSILEQMQARGLMAAIVIMCMFVAIGVVLFLGSEAVIDGRLSGGDFSAFIFYAIVVASTLNSLTDILGDLRRAGGAAERLVDLIEVKKEASDRHALDALQDPLPPAIHFENVSFAYPSRPEAFILKQMSFTVHPGEVVALVAPSGTGKTTLFNLLLGFYEPLEGDIRLNQQSCRHMSLQALRQSMALVPQDPVLFSGTILNNIRYGREDATDAQIIEVAKRANVDTFVSQLKDGYQSLVGEKGIRLSGGQRQRIAIARALLKNAPILLLDEATSSLDAVSETTIYDQLHKALGAKKITTLIITHRLATIQKVGRILVMDEGRIVAEGSHEELLRKNDLYRNLAALQFCA